MPSTSSSASSIHSNASSDLIIFSPQAKTPGANGQARVVSSEEHDLLSFSDGEGSSGVSLRTLNNESTQLPDTSIIDSSNVEDCGPECRLGCVCPVADAQMSHCSCDGTVDKNDSIHQTDSVGGNDDADETGNVGENSDVTAEHHAVLRVGSASYHTSSENHVVDEDGLADDDDDFDADNEDADESDDEFFFGGGVVDQAATIAAERAERQRVLDRIAEEDGHYADVLRRELRMSQNGVQGAAATATATASDPTITIPMNQLSLGADHTPSNAANSSNHTPSNAAISPQPTSNEQREPVEWLVAQVHSPFAEIAFIDIDRTDHLVVLKLRFLEINGLEPDQLNDLCFYFGQHVIGNAETGDTLEMGPTPRIWVQTDQVQESYLESFELRKHEHQKQEAGPAEAIE